MASARNLTRATVLAARLEVAGSLWGKFKGLMGRPSLAEGDGLPIGLFADAGVAWTEDIKPGFLGGDRDWVRSVGVGLRFNAFGYAIGEFDYVKPLDRPDSGWIWQFNLTPGF